MQVCWKEQGRVVKTVHVGSASTEKHLEKLLREAQGIIDGEKQLAVGLSFQIQKATKEKDLF